jgi:tetraacyldisaccharide 4'-kinase
MYIWHCCYAYLLFGIHLKIQQIIENHWYLKDTFALRLLLNLFLIPFSLAFYVISRIRYFCYKVSICKSYKLPVPVVIIGNISVGGSGKTPLTKYIAKELTNNNIKVGVILRGYKSKTFNATIIKKNDNPEMVGDEALIYANNDIPVAIGTNRYLTGLKLLEIYPDIQVILSDDGMQHYRLKRDYEIAVIDKSRIFGNRFILPNGPLRETISRFKKVNAIVINSQEELDNSWVYDKLKLSRSDLKNQLILHQTLRLQKIYNPLTHETFDIPDLKEKNIVAIAAIGNPERFFNFIANNGIKLSHQMAFSDHYYYQKHDIPNNYAIILTSEKDYTKLAKFNDPRIWVVEVTSILSSSSIIDKIITLVSAHSKH